MADKKFYLPARDRKHDADLCYEEPDGSVRDAAGRLIYKPGKHFRVPKADMPTANRAGAVSFVDQTWEEYQDPRRVLHPEPFYPASLAGIAAYLASQSREV